MAPTAQTTKKVKSITYDITVDITTINGSAPTPNMPITGATLNLEGTADATETIIFDPDGDETDDISDQLQIFVKFDSSATPRLATSSGDGKQWSLSVPVPIGNADADGHLLITAIAKLPVTPKQATRLATVDVDNTPPTLTIVRPLPDETIVLTAASVAVPLEVTATDSNLVTEVKWSLESKNYPNALVLDQSGRGITQVQVTAPRQQTIYVRAKDNFNNVAEQSVTIDVVPPFTPVDPDDLTGQISYLGDLLDFAAKRIQVSTPPSPAEPTVPSATDFTTIFCQRFTELIDPQNHAVVLHSVHQIRISVDVLRHYLLARVPQWRDHPQDLTATEAAYRQQAYAALLRSLGTSDREL